MKPYLYHYRCYTHFPMLLPIKVYSLTRMLSRGKACTVQWVGQRFRIRLWCEFLMQLAKMASLLGKYFNSLQISSAKSRAPSMHLILFKVSDTARFRYGHSNASKVLVVYTFECQMLLASCWKPHHNTALHIDNERVM